MAWLVVSCSDVDRSHIDALKSECGHLTRKRIDFNRSDSLARELLEYGRLNDDAEATAFGLYYLGVYDGDPTHVEERLPRLMECHDMLEPGRDDSLLLKVYTALGIYEVSHFRNFPKGADYFTKSMEMARRLGDEHKAIVAEQNLSAIMVFTNDTLGIKYDEDIFRYAKECNDTALMQSSAAHCGLYYASRNLDNDKALYYANIIKNRHDKENYICIMAYIAMNKKNYKEAERLFRQQLTINPDNADANLKYGELLKGSGHYSESIRYLEKAESSFMAMGTYGPLPTSARLMSDNYAMMGDTSKAYYWAKVYSQRLDSLQAIRQHEEVARARVKFDTMKKEHTIELQKAEMKNIYIVIFFVVLICILIVALSF
ncbi:MAG: tetratricopeptide repeat protein, partial [Muribaculaceae bacterium]